jgi:5'-nucleotidase
MSRTLALLASLVLLAALRPGLGAPSAPSGSAHLEVPSSVEIGPAGTGDWPPPDELLSWTAPEPARASESEVHLLAFNDFHGHLERPATVRGRPAGGAAVLAAYLEAAEREHPGRTLIVHAGDQFGASPPVTRLNGNEPAMQFLNLLADDDCHYGAATHFYDAATWREHPDRCNVIGTLGNHEFDGGLGELMRLLEGGNAAAGPYLENPYRGSRVPYVCANVRDRRTGRLVLPPYAVVVVAGIPIGIIGAVLRDTPNIAPAWQTENLEFLDEATSINRAAAELQRGGVHTIIVTIHQGAVGTRAPGGWAWRGPLVKIVSRLDPTIDVVISGHTHHYTDALLPDRAGRAVLVTQAYAFGVAYADITLQIDTRTHEVTAKSARIIPTWADAGPGLSPDAQVAALTAAAMRSVAPRIERVVGWAAAPITRGLTPAGESALGDLVADAQRAATRADFALMNPGGLRTDIAAGPITRGEILTLHPFGNRLVTMTLTGAQLRAVLEEQWPADPNALPRVLKTSGLYYVWDPRRPAGHRVVAACDAEHRPLDPSRIYRVTANDFLAAGGDEFYALRAGRNEVTGPFDADALAQYLAALRGPLEVHADGRIALAGSAGASICNQLNRPSPAPQAAILPSSSSRSRVF